MDGALRNRPCLYLVVPCYNEEEILSQTADILKEKIDRLIQAEKISKCSRIMFVNDGSSDGTLSILVDIAHRDDHFAIVSLTGNRGQQNAIWAGLMTAKKADVVITIDADLQQDIEAFDKFLECYKNGAEVVYGIRKNREGDGVFKRASALSYYRFLHMMGIDVIKNHSDYRLISRKVIDALSMYNESNLFLRGLIPTLGFPSDVVYYDVKKRTKGKSKYTLDKMILLGTDGITSLTTRPLRLISVLGVAVVFLSIFNAIWCTVDLINGRVINGYTMVLLVLLFASGVILVSLGIIGEYVGKIYVEAKKRPRYIIDSVILRDSQDED